MSLPHFGTGPKLESIWYCPFGGKPPRCGLATIIQPCRSSARANSSASLSPNSVSQKASSHSCLVPHLTGHQYCTVVGKRFRFAMIFPPPVFLHEQTRIPPAGCTPCTPAGGYKGGA